MINRKKVLSLVLLFFVLFTSPYYMVKVNATEAAEGPEEDVEVADDRIIPAGITIAGIDVAGMTVDEALEAVDESFSIYNDVKFTLNINEKTVEATGEDLSICAKNSDVAVKAATYGTYGNLAERFKANADMEAGRGKDFKISVGANVADIVEYLEKVADKTDDKPINNGVIRENGEFKYVAGSSGVVLMVSKSADDIVRFIENDWDGSDASFTLSTMVEEPKGTEEELATITDILGSYSTDYSTSSANRKNNVANGARLINGTTLYPGEVFSVLEAIVPFTAENGYMLAGSYENGTTVETYGGGICQVSTTLYGAVRAAEVAVATRSCHSMIVNYVPPSQDAAISESGSKDFQIRNNKETPIYIEGYCENNRIYFNIYGKETREETHKVSYDTEITGVTIQNTQYVADPNLPLGVMKVTTSGHTGYVARLWKTITEDGVEISRDVYNNSRYNPSDRVVNIGIASTNQAASEGMAAAIATQNVDAIAGAISYFAPGVQNSVSFEIVPKYNVTALEEAAEAAAADDGITNDTSAVNSTTGEVVGN